MAISPHTVTIVNDCSYHSFYYLYDDFILLEIELLSGGCLMRVPVLIQKHGQKCKQVLLLGSFCKAVLLANSGFWQASTRSAIQKCIYFLYECVFPKNLHYLSGSTLSLGTFCKAVLFAFYDFLSTSTLIRAADSHAL